MNQRLDAINNKIDSILTTLHWDRQDLKNWYIQVRCYYQLFGQALTCASLSRNKPNACRVHTIAATRCPVIDSSLIRKSVWRNGNMVVVQEGRLVL